MRNIFFLLLLLTNCVTAQIQSLTINGWNVEYYIPSSNALKLPAVVFFPGNGEVGFDRTKLYVNGPMRFIRDAGWRPNHIVVACQFPQGWANANVVQTFLDTLIVKYKVDPNCFHLTGLSGGAYSIWNYMRTAGVNFRSPKSIVPFSYSWTPGANDDRYINIKQWLICGWFDSFYGNANAWHNTLSSLYKNSKFTTYKLPIGSSTQSQSGHCCWNSYYDPNWKEGGKNIYEWAMSNCNTVLNLPADSVVVRSRVQQPDYIQTDRFWKFNKRGVAVVYRADGARVLVKEVVLGTEIKRERITDKLFFY